MTHHQDNSNKKERRVKIISKKEQSLGGGVYKSLQLQGRSINPVNKTKKLNVAKIQIKRNLRTQTPLSQP